MFVCPMSSPKMTRMFGRWPDGAGVCGCCACAVCTGAVAASAEAAARVVPARRILRRLTSVACLSLVAMTFSVTKRELVPPRRPIPYSIARGAIPRAINRTRILRSARRLARHHVLHDADDKGEDGAGRAAAHGLAEQRADIDAAARACEHRDEL